MLAGNPAGKEPAMSKRRKRNHRARKAHTGNETGDPTTTYDDLPSEESIPIEG